MICEETHCKNCNNQYECELRLPYDKYLIKAQKRIQTILIQLNNIEKDIDYYLTVKKDIKNGKYGEISEVKKIVNIDYNYCKNKKRELVPQLRELRRFEQERIKILRRRQSY